MDSCIRLLRELVAIDSVNPTLVPGAAGEAEIARAVADELTRIGLDVEVRDAAPGRPTVVGVAEGRANGRSLMFCGHLDTVGVEGMVAPFDPRERDGRLYGRGAQDMKGGLASMIDAARVLVERGFPKGRLIVAAVADEEFASLGADALVRTWTADGAVVTEPTDLDVGIGHKGFVWLDVETRGVAAHGSRPADGRDAIMRMGRVLQRLEALDRALQGKPAHPVLGTGSLHASIIGGGRERSSYPDLCGLQMERRTIDGESEAQALEEVQAILETLGTEDAEFEGSAVLRFARPPYQLDAGHDLVRMMSGAAAIDHPRVRQVGMSFWTDAAILAGAGIPSVLFGPGGAGLHGTEEYVRVGDVLACRDSLVRLASTWC